MLSDCEPPVEIKPYQQLWINIQYCQALYNYWNSTSFLETLKPIHWAGSRKIG